MVILFSDRKSVVEKEIISILTNFGATYISDKRVICGNTPITVIGVYKKTDLNIKKGVAVMLGVTNRFKEQKFTNSIIGICESSDKEAVEIFSKSPIAVISCGMGTKNTVTVSSIKENTALVTFQRNLTDIYGKTIEPAEYKIKLKGKYSEFSVMASTAILLLHGINPELI